MIKIRSIDLCPSCFSPYLSYDVTVEVIGISVDTFDGVDEYPYEPRRIKCCSCGLTITSPLLGRLIYYNGELYALTMEHFGLYYRIVKIPSKQGPQDNILLFDSYPQVLARLKSNEIMDDLTDILWFSSDEQLIEHSFRSLLQLASMS